MDALLRDAEGILETALAAGRDGGEWAVVVGAAGGIRLLDPAGWNLAALAAEYGARSAFRVRRRAGTVRVEGWSGSRTCVLEQESFRARDLLVSSPRKGFSSLDLVPYDV